MNRKMTRKGFGLVELVICIIIIGIIGTAALTAGRKQVSKSRISTISSNLQVLASDIERAIVDLDFLTDVTNTTSVTNYFNMWDKKYMTSPLDIANIEIVLSGDDQKFGVAYSGVIIPSINYADPWGNEIRIIYMIPVAGDAYRIIAASAGPNGKYAPSADNGYQDNVFDDDVVLIMEPRDI